MPATSLFFFPPPFSHVSHSPYTCQRHVRSSQASASEKELGTVKVLAGATRQLQAREDELLDDRRELEQKIASMHAELAHARQLAGIGAGSAAAAAAAAAADDQPPTPGARARADAAHAKLRAARAEVDAARADADASRAEADAARADAAAAESGAAIAIDAATARSAALEAELLALRQRSAPVEETSRDAGGRAALWATAEAAAATERALRAEVSLSPPIEFADTPPFSPCAAPRFPHMSEMNSPFPF